MWLAAVFRHSAVRMAISRNQHPEQAERRKDTAARAVSIPLVEPKVRERKLGLVWYLDVCYEYMFGKASEEDE